ncbi:hypothetical protein Nepgr_005251 [Nepenthes gracilis]|uniref:Uncharacterized protein n=1 Tax=Nepenthes gracilis TaxID=150966 RepID=A0AAD3S2U8_NEPGR|nr:hypothetical protein Nepgr_005251 [Nepenthes gracilis]
MPPIDVYGKSGKCSVAEEALPQPESLPTPIAVLNLESLSGGIETPALPFDDSRALTRPNSPSTIRCLRQTRIWGLPGLLI